MNWPRRSNTEIERLETRVSELETQLETELETRADTSYTDALVTALLRQAQGRNHKPALVSATGALEACAGKIGLAFAGAEIKGREIIINSLAPDLMAMIGRALIRRGEIVLLIDTESGNLRLTPAMSHSIAGGPNPDTWEYDVSLPGPSETATYSVSAARVVHLMYARDPETPWRGIGPIGVAALAGELSAETVSALADESGGPRGSFMPLPKDGDDPTIENLKSDMRTAGGKMLAVESTAYWNGGGTAPSGGTASSDWQQKRFGANPPAGLVNVAELATREIYAACGLSSALFGGSDAPGTREAWRLALFGTIAPLGRIVETELRRKLDDDVSLSWDELRASDLSGRARAFQSMVGGGMDVDKAAALAGLLTE